MNRYIIGSLWDRLNRNSVNKNFEYLFEGSKRIDELNNMAEGILTEAKKTNNINKNVQKQVDDLILYAGESDAEVIQARGEHNVLNQRFVSIESVSDKNGLHSSEFPRLTSEVDDTNALNRMIEYAELYKYNNINFDGDYIINGTLKIYNNKNYMFNNGSIKQTKENTAMFSGDNLSNVNFERTGDFVLTGYENDFVEAYGRASVAILAKSTIAPSNNLVSKNMKIEKFSHSGITVFNALNCRFEDNKITGTVKWGRDEGKNYQFGISLNDNPKNTFVLRNEISFTTQGILLGKDFENIRIEDNTITDIVGQHGLYINYGNVLNVSKNTIERTNFQGIKTQLDGHAENNSSSIVITENTIKHPGIHGILIANVQVTPTLFTTNLNISDNVITGISSKTTNGAGIRVDYGSLVSVRNNSIKSMQYGLHFLDSDKVKSQGNNIEDVGYNALLNQNSSIHVLSDYMLDAGTVTGTNSEQAIAIYSDKEVILDDVLVDEANNNMTYSLICSSLVTGRNLSIRNCKFLKKPLRLGQNVTSLKEYDNNEVHSIWGNFYPSKPVLGRRSNVYHGTRDNAPSSNTNYKAGDRYEYTDPVAGGYLGLILIGSIWKAYGKIEV